jgi:hypothetical protein
MGVSWTYTFLVLAITLTPYVVSAADGSIACDADNFNVTCTSGDVTHDYNLNDMWYYAHVGWQCAVSALVIGSVALFSTIVYYGLIRDPLNVRISKILDERSAGTRFH